MWRESLMGSDGPEGWWGLGRNGRRPRPSGTTA